MQSIYKRHTHLPTSHTHLPTSHTHTHTHTHAHTRARTHARTHTHNTHTHTHTHTRIRVSNGPRLMATLHLPNSSFFQAINSFPSKLHSNQNVIYSLVVGSRLTSGDVGINVFSCLPAGSSCCWSNGSSKGEVS